jgi:hypothetical protein
LSKNPSPNSALAKPRFKLTAQNPSKKSGNISASRNPGRSPGTVFLRPDNISSTPRKWLFPISKIGLRLHQAIQVPSSFDTADAAYYRKISSITFDSQMPHLFVNRHRLHDLTSAHSEQGNHFKWETINAIIYKIGGLLFVIGSVFFFPRYEAYGDLGALIFFFGSLFYLVVTGHDMCEVVHYWHAQHPHTTGKTLEFTAAIAYLMGTLLFTVGSLFFLSALGWIVAGAWCFVIGSLLFLVGACINIIQMVQDHSYLALRFMILTAICFMIGSVLFVLASIPYLWTIDNVADRYTLFSFMAWEFEVGSLLFLLGGVYHYSRAYLLRQDEIQ